MSYSVLIERTSNGWAASVPDLPGCIAAGATRQEVQQLIEQAMALHVAKMRQKGLPIPRPSAYVVQVELAAKAKSRKQA